VADILSKCIAKVILALLVQRNCANGDGVKVTENFVGALIKRIPIVPYYVEMSLMRGSREQSEFASNGAVQNRN
jgi:hypothetical protein